MFGFGPILHKSFSASISANDASWHWGTGKLCVLWFTLKNFIESSDLDYFKLHSVMVFEGMNVLKSLLLLCSIFWLERTLEG